jgi:regulator of ribonuclease activity A
MSSSSPSPLPPATSTSSSLLSFIPTCDLYDRLLERAKIPGHTDGGGTIQWRSFGPVRCFCGYAVTVQCFEDNSRVKELVETKPLLKQTEGRQKNVLVVDGGGSMRMALLGDRLAACAVQNGWAGLVIYGCVRDVDVLRTMDDLGLVALGCTPRKSVRRDQGEVHVPITIGDVLVRPGDAVYVDNDGVVFLDPSLVAGGDDNDDDGQQPSSPTNDA